MIDVYDKETLRELFFRHGFVSAKSFGQNFLIDDYAPREMARLLPPGAGVVEIGVGAGALTAALLPRAAKVVGLEADKKLAPLQKELFGGEPKLEILYTDALKCDFAQLCAGRLAGLETYLCANLPYNITTKTVEKAAACGAFCGIALMLQKEAAERICAKSGTRAASLTSLIVEACGAAEILFEVGPESFYPAPRVRSAVLYIDLQKPALIGEERARVLKLAEAAYALRRKTLVNALAASGRAEYTKDRVQKSLEKLGLPPETRGEKLTLAQFAQLSKLLL